MSSNVYSQFWSVGTTTPHWLPPPVSVRFLTVPYTRLLCHLMTGSWGRGVCFGATPLRSTNPILSGAWWELYSLGSCQGGQDPLLFQHGKILTDTGFHCFSGCMDASVGNLFTPEWGRYSVSVFIWRQINLGKTLNPFFTATYLFRFATRVCKASRHDAFIEFFFFFTHSGIKITVALPCSLVRCEHEQMKMQFSRINRITHNYNYNLILFCVVKY